MYSFIDVGYLSVMSMLRNTVIFGSSAHDSITCPWSSHTALYNCLRLHIIISSLSSLLAVAHASPMWPHKQTTRTEHALYRRRSCWRAEHFLKARASRQIQHCFWLYSTVSWSADAIGLPFLQRAQCSHCKRCITYSNSVCLSVCPSVRLSVTCRYCVKTAARSTVQFAPLDSKMCLVL